MPRTILCLLVSIAIFLFASTLTTAAWQVVPNPVTGNPEAIWSSQSDEATTNVLYSYLDGEDWAPSTTLSGSGKDNSSLVLAFDANGGRRAVWESEDGRILLRALQPSGGAWSEETLISETTEIGSGPSAVMFSGNTYVSYEATSTGASRTVTVSKVDPGSNVERTLITTTCHTSPLATQLHTEQTFLWVDWIDSDSSLGYSELENGVWSTVLHEPYDGSGDIKAARERVRQAVLTGE